MMMIIIIIIMRRRRIWRMNEEEREEQGNYEASRWMIMIPRTSSFSLLPVSPSVSSVPVPFSSLFPPSYLFHSRGSLLFVSFILVSSLPVCLCPCLSVFSQFLVPGSLSLRLFQALLHLSRACCTHSPSSIKRSDTRNEGRNEKTFTVMMK